MINNSPDQEALVSFLLRIYNDLLKIEEKFGLIVGLGDMRPRIDYFHDAVRAFTSGDYKLQKNRLSVELLAYDLRCLRYIQKMPLAPFKQGGENLSSQQGVITVGEGMLATTNRPDRETKELLVDLYKNYTVMFAALLKPAADHDYAVRTEDADEQARDIFAVTHQLETKPDINILANMAQAVQSDELRVILTKFLQQQKHKNKDEINKLLANLKIVVANKDKAIKAVDKAHMDFVMTQLGIFEDSKDLLKKMAKQGMNVVGKFVENAIADSKRQMGR
jgi:hypothetical protein